MIEDDWFSVINTNLISIFALTQYVVQNMAKAWNIDNSLFGRIINISSVSGQQGAFGTTNYSASKAGIIGFTKALSYEVAKKNITVNAIAPGMIETEMIKSIPPNYLDTIKSQIPMQRFGSPQEIADMAFFLASNQASYITGQVLNVNGGMYV